LFSLVLIPFKREHFGLTFRAGTLPVEVKKAPSRK
jgi:hypothetical protein